MHFPGANRVQAPFVVSLAGPRVLPAVQHHFAIHCLDTCTIAGGCQVRFCNLRVGFHHGISLGLGERWPNWEVARYKLWRASMYIMYIFYNIYIYVYIGIGYLGLGVGYISINSALTPSLDEQIWDTCNLRRSHNSNYQGPKPPMNHTSGTQERVIFLDLP